MEKAMLSFYICLVALGVCAVSSEDQNEECKSNIMLKIMCL